jgi:hypothetical protein
MDLSRGLGDVYKRQGLAFSEIDSDISRPVSKQK